MTNSEEDTYSSKSGETNELVQSGLCKWLNTICSVTFYLFNMDDTGYFVKLVYSQRPHFILLLTDEVMKVRFILKSCDLISMKSR